jgi:hypothetical protein
LLNLQQIFGSAAKFSRILKVNDHLNVVFGFVRNFAATSLMFLCDAEIKKRAYSIFKNRDTHSHPSIDKPLEEHFA